MLLLYLLFFQLVRAPPPPSVPTLVGAPTGACMGSAGYTWCGSSRSCVRVWETPCADRYESCADCLAQQRAGVNIACPRKCDTYVVNTEDPCTCPPQPPCPPSPTIAGCTVHVPPPDECGCIEACPSLQCGEGASCGGFALSPSACTAPLECVATMGPYIADAPGTCRTPCPTQRDAFGNCVDANCKVWYDGCNTCRIDHARGSSACTEMFCDISRGMARCVDARVAVQAGGVCERFCEDGSETPVSAKCAEGLQCVHPMGVGFDTCGQRAARCTVVGH